MHTYAFEKLDVWQEARKLVAAVYTLTRNYPSDEKFGIVNQMRRCAVSIPSNIAEGSARKTSKDQAHFYTMAYGSLMELLNQLILSADLNFISSEDLINLRISIESLSNKINALRRSTEL
ncbi:MAG: four helix bundle protein [Flaviaesturariibacter sp.]|nr:four helix bundle protein [Flaviaesturariibacter sp.]